MGSDKALLRLGGETFISRLIRILEGKVSPVIVILGYHANEIRNSLPEIHDLKVLLNNDYNLGQLSSLKIALAHLDNLATEGALIYLVDHPAMSRGVVDQLLDNFERSKASVLIPTYEGRRGHPVLFARSLYDELQQAPLELGARAVVRRHEAETELVPVDDPGILIDVDTPADYQELLNKWESLTASREESSGQI